MFLAECVCVRGGEGEEGGGEGEEGGDEGEVNGY